MLRITDDIALPDREIRMRAIRAQGAGGQNVNKVASAVQLSFDIHASSLPDAWRRRLLARNDRRISAAGVIVIKAQQHRTQERNRVAALERLVQLIRTAARPPRPRLPTAPSAASRRRRLEHKQRHGRQKRLRAARPAPDEA
jgi:ribosome-associated protein